MSPTVTYDVYSLRPVGPNCVDPEKGSCRGPFHVYENPNGCMFWTKCGNFPPLGKKKVNVSKNQSTLF